MKQQLSQPHSWVNDAREKRNHGIAVGGMPLGNDELNSTSEEPSTSRRNTTLPRHKSSCLRFLTWIAFYRKPYSNTGINQQQFCPVNECNVPPFQSQGEMLQHVGDCPELQKGTYHCPNCKKHERISRFHGDSCIQPHNPFQKARNSLRSVKSMFILHESTKQAHHAAERTVSGQAFPQHLIELDSHSNIPELPSYHPTSFISEMESPVANGNDWSWSTQKAMDVQSASSGAKPDHSRCYSAVHPALRSEAMNQSTYGIPKYSMSLASGSNQNFVAVELSAMPVSGDHSGRGQRSHNCVCSASQATQAVTSWIPSLSSAQDANVPPTEGKAQDLQMEPTQDSVYETMHHNHQSQSAEYRPLRPYISQGSVSSTGSFSTAGVTSRSSTVSSTDLTSSSRNTSFSEQDTTHETSTENQALAIICEGNDMLYDDPDEMDFMDWFQSPAATLTNLQPLGLRNDFKDPIEWPLEYLATTTRSQQPNTGSSQVQLPPQHSFSPTHAQQIPVLTDTSPVSSAEVPSIPKPSSPLRHRKRANALAPTATSSSSSSSSSHAKSKQKLATKAKTPYACQCRKIMDRTNTARHRRTCRTQAPVFSKRKNFKCPFKNCSSSGFTRLDNLKVHQGKQGHFLQTNFESHQPAGDINGQRGAEFEVWNGETYILAQCSDGKI